MNFQIELSYYVPYFYLCFTYVFTYIDSVLPWIRLATFGTLEGLNALSVTSKTMNYTHLYSTRSETCISWDVHIMRGPKRIFCKWLFSESCPSEFLLNSFRKSFFHKLLKSLRILYLGLGMEFDVFSCCILCYL